MILKELQNFLLNYRCVSLAEMERHFQIEAEALRGMLAKLIKKGRVKKLPPAEKCHSCTGCDRDALEFYEWTNPTNLIINPSSAQEIELRIEDLHCQMCAQTVKEALQQVEGVARVRVDLAQKRVAIAYCQAKRFQVGADREVKVKSAIEALKPTGYRAEPILTDRSA